MSHDFTQASSQPIDNVRFMHRTMSPEGYQGLPEPPVVRRLGEDTEYPLAGLPISLVLAINHFEPPKM